MLGVEDKKKVVVRKRKLDKHVLFAPLVNGALLDEKGRYRPDWMAPPTESRNARFIKDLAKMVIQNNKEVSFHPVCDRPSTHHITG